MRAAPPDYALHNGRIHTVDGADRVVEAIAFTGSRISAVGSNADVLATAGPATARIDVGRRVVTPGLIDGHAHLDREGLRRSYPGLAGARSIADVQRAVAAEATRQPRGEWVVLMPLGEPPFHETQADLLAERRFPTRRELDAAAPDHPVWIRAPWGFWSNRLPGVHVLNSAALAACGIDRGTASPSSVVTIERDEHGELTGRIFEHHYTTVAELELLARAPRFSAQMRRDGLRAAIGLAHAAGITGVFEGHGVAQELLAAYRDVHRMGALRLRATLPISPGPWGSVAEFERHLDAAGGPAAAGDDGPLRIDGVYLSFGGNAAVRDAGDRGWPYTGWAGFKDQANSPKEYEALCRAAAGRGVRVSTIVGGALATSATLDAVLSIWERIAADAPIAPRRWVLGHVGLADPVRDLPRVKRLGAVLTTLPASYLYRSGADAIRSGARPAELMPYRTWTAAALPWSLSTDNKPYGMLFTLWTVMARETIGGGEVIAPEERLSFAQALRAATAAPAHLTFDEGTRGSLEVGKAADAVVLDGDPTADLAGVAEMASALTFVGGRIVHSAMEGARAQ